MMHPGKAYPIKFWHNNGVLSLWILDNFQKSYELGDRQFSNEYAGTLQTIYVATDDPTYVRDMNIFQKL